MVLAIPSTAAMAQANSTVMSPSPDNASSPAMFAYVGSRTTRERNARGNGINVYRMDRSTGAWTHVQLVKELINPSFLALDNEQRFLYSVHGDLSEISAFRRDAGTGALTFLNRQSTGGTNPVHLVVDPSNHFVVVANYETGSLATLPINADGSLGTVVDLIRLPGDPGPHKTQQKGAHPHDVPYDPKRRFIVVPDKGLDRIFVFRLDSATGKLTPNTPPYVKAREGSGPRHVAFQPNSRFAYVVNELDSSVTMYRYDDAGGTLEPVEILPLTPSNFVNDNTGAEIAVAASGRFAYVSNRGHDSITIFSIDGNAGTLTPVKWVPSQGKGPRFFAIDPSGKFLYAANENSDTIVTFRLDQSSGDLVPTGQVVQTGSPVCIVFAQDMTR
jgi:6-phosphogluconolactonase (cycloisomerase 2 family)